MQDGKYVILCVDDDPDVLATSEVILEKNDYVFVGAPSAEEGLKKYDEVSPDFVLVDLMMEEVDAGTNMVKELKAKGNKAPVYMLSSVGDALSSNMDYDELGLSGVFQKPIKPDNLLSILKSKLG